MQMKGVLLVNLGSPDSTNTNDVRNSPSIEICKTYRASTKTYRNRIKNYEILVGT